MNVIKKRAIDTALRTLDDGDRQKMLAWFDHLGNWENDEQIRKMVKPTIERDTFALNTHDDMRIFFKLNEADKEIEIVGLARPSRFAAAGVTME